MNLSEIKADYNITTKQPEPIEFRSFAGQETFNNPTEREKLIYENTHFVPWTQLVEITPNGVANFDKKAIFRFPKTDTDVQIAKMTLKMRVSDPMASIKAITDIISKVEITVNDNPIQSYYGRFLEILDSMRTVKNYIVEGVNKENMVESKLEKEIYLELPFFPDLDNRVRANKGSYEVPERFLDAKCFPLGLIGQQQDLAIKMTFADKKYPEADVLYAGIYVEMEHRHPIEEAKLVKPHEMYMNWKEVQFTGTENLYAQAHKIRLNFKGPIETLFWKLYLVNEKDEVMYWPTSLMKSAKLLHKGQELMCLQSNVYYNEIVPTKLAGRASSDPNTFCYTFIPTSEMDRQLEIGREPRGSFNDEDLVLIIMVCSTDNLPEGWEIRLETHAHVWSRMCFRDGRCGLLRDF